MNDLVLPGLTIVIGLTLLLWSCKRKAKRTEQEPPSLFAENPAFATIIQHDPAFQDFFKLTQLYQRLGVSEAAEKELRQILQWHPGNVNVRLAVARLAMIQGDREQARQELQELIRYEPDHIVAHSLLSVLAKSTNA